MKIDFSRDAWTTDEIIYAYSYRFPETPVFRQLDDCVENREDPAASCAGYDFITLMTKEKYGPGTKITARCAYEGDAAPLLVFADQLDRCEDGYLRYGNYFEVVLYKNGINVWRLWKKEDGTVTWHKRLGVEFPVTEGEIHTLSVEIREQDLLIEADGFRMTLRTEDFFPAFHAGINACEGICRFYDMTVE